MGAVTTPVGAASGLTGSGDPLCLAATVNRLASSSKAKARRCD
jgi:hypothetical protein